MAITQADAITQIRARLDEPSSVYWTEVDLRIWINDIARDMARRTESLRTTFDQAVVAGTATYSPTFAAANQPYRIYGCDFIPTGQTLTYPLEYRDRQSAIAIWGIMQATEGTPAIWTSWSSPPTITIQVYPSPSQTGTLRLYYYRLPNILATSDTSDQSDVVDIVDGWEDVLVDGVEYKAMRRDSDPRWQEAKQEYEQHLEAMMEATIRFSDAAGQITTPSGSYIPAWLYGGGDW